MIRLKLYTLVICAAGLLVFQACTSKKETPQPVVDTQRLDQLRQELRDLQVKVLGDASTYSHDSLSYEQLVLQVNALLAQYAKHVTYSVIVGDYQGNYLSGVTVKVSQAGAVASQTTSASGVATFPNLNGGIISATAELTGFSRLVFKADIRNYNSDQAYSAASNVLLLPTGGTPASDAGMCTFNINLYANFTTVNDTLGGPDQWPGTSTLALSLPAGPNPDFPKISYTAMTDKPITAYLRNWFLNSARPPSGFTYGNSNFSSAYGNVYDPGSVLTVAYENVSYPVASAGPNGSYVVKLPATSIFDSNSFSFDLVFTEFSNSFTDYVPGGTGVHIKPPFDPTYTATQVFRVGTGHQLQSNQAGNLDARKYFYANTLN
jgi:hypothetical protein